MHYEYFQKPHFSHSLLVGMVLTALLGGSAAWLQVRMSNQTEILPAPTYRALPEPPANLEAIIQDLELADMYAMAMQDDHLEDWLVLLGPRVVMEEMYKDRDASARTDCHTAAHLIGHSSFELFGLAAFGAGNELCHSGYNHGVIEEYIDTVGTADIAKKLQTVCTSVPTTFSQLQCFHGAGHGLMSYLKNDLPTSLQLCKAIPQDRQRQSCYGGVFMENVVSAIEVDGVANHPTRWANKDPYFPCNSVSQDTETQRACYGMQTTLLFALYANNVEQVVTACKKAPEKNALTCFESFGRDLVGIARYEPEPVTRGCAVLANKEYTAHCMTGAVRAVVNFYGPNLANEATIFCNALLVDQRDSCNAAALEYIATLK